MNLCIKTPTYEAAKLPEAEGKRRFAGDPVGHKLVPGDQGELCARLMLRVDLLVVASHAKPKLT